MDKSLNSTMFARLVPDPFARFGVYDLWLGAGTEACFANLRIERR